ncbi:MAG: CobW family GTP-binding protein [Thermosynechococcaceae cyanobacterium]
MLPIPGQFEHRLPVTIITGFLGSGKTTLLNHLLRHLGDRRVAVLVNEFGAIDIDSQILVAVDEDMVSLANGCVCCQVRDDFLMVLRRLLAYDQMQKAAGKKGLEAILLETSGVADPYPIMLTFRVTELWSLTRLDAVLTVVDAETFTSEHFQSQTALAQIQHGDIILLNKTDLVDDEQLRYLETEMLRLKPQARVLHMTDGQVPLSSVLDVDLCPQEMATGLTSTAQHLQNDGFVAVSFESDRPFVLKKFQQFLDYHLPKEVFRAKGVLWFTESPHRHLFQLSGKRSQIQDESWLHSPHNQLVCIGRNLDSEQLQRQLQQCLALSH